MAMPVLSYVLQWHGYLICNANKWYMNLNERKDKDREEEHLHKLKFKKKDVKEQTVTTSRENKIRACEKMIVNSWPL